MPTSGAWTFSLTGAQLIASAFEDLHILIPGGTIVPANETLALRRLNIIIKQWQGDSDMFPGVPVHTRQRVTMLFAKGQQTYLLGPASTDARASTQVGRTTISAAEAIGQTVLSITSNTDTTSYPGTTITMTASDIVGIELDDGTIQWTTISGTPASTMTVANALTVAAAAGNYVWWFTTRAQRFPVIESAVLRDENFNDTPLDVYTQAEQYDQGVTDKTADGTPTSILVEPLRITTRVTLNTQPTDVTDTLVLTVLYPAEDMSAVANDIAFPQEWFRPLLEELKFSIAPVFGIPWTAEREAARQQALTWARSLNPENSVLYYRPGGL